MAWRFESELISAVTDATLDYYRHDTIHMHLARCSRPRQTLLRDLPQSTGPLPSDV